ncbi:MAG: glycosyl transferase family 2 [Blastocatellia bacterium]
MRFFRKLQTIARILENEGLPGIRMHLRLLRLNGAMRRRYRRWLRSENSTVDLNRDPMIRAARALSHRPLISVLLPVYNIDEPLLRKCIDSVRGQSYENWQLCIADDFSPSPHVRRILEEYAKIDSRINVIFRAENGHISAASNSALELAKGEFTALLDHDDQLSSDAFFWIAREIESAPDVAMIYSDEDKIDRAERRFDPAFKPDWSRDLFYSLNLVTHLSVFRTSVLRQIGGFRLGLEGSQDYDLALRFLEQIDERKIRHVPRILYHWRAISGSVALDGGEKPYAHENARRALRSHFERLGVAVEVSGTVNCLHRVRYPLPENVRIRVIVAGAESEREIKAFRQTSDVQSAEFLAFKQSTWSPDDINDVGQDDVFCFVNAGLMPIGTSWLSELAGFAATPGIGCAGAKIVGSAGETLAGGIVFGSGRAAMAHFGYPANADGNMFRNKVISNFSAVSAAAFAIRGDLLRQFRRMELLDLYGIVDLCLTLRDFGYRIVHTPNAIFLADKRLRRQIKRYRPFRAVEDPFANPNLEVSDGTMFIDA